jgi:hypothetical protein
MEAAMDRRRALFSALMLAITAPVCSQELAREFPLTALRGVVAFSGPPAVVLNDAPVLLAPGARLHGTDNLLVLPTTLTGSSHTVHYTIEDQGTVDPSARLNGRTSRGPKRSRSAGPGISTPKRSSSKPSAAR